MQLLDIMIIPAESEMTQKGLQQNLREKVVYSLAARDFFHQSWISNLSLLPTRGRFLHNTKKVNPLHKGVSSPLKLTLLPPDGLPGAFNC